MPLQRLEFPFFHLPKVANFYWNSTLVYCWIFFLRVFLTLCRHKKKEKKKSLVVKGHWTKKISPWHLTVHKKITWYKNCAHKKTSLFLFLKKKHEKTNLTACCSLSIIINVIHTKTSKIGELAWERIIGPPWEAKSSSLFIISTIFCVNPCMAIWKIHKNMSIIKWKNAKKKEVCKFQKYFQAGDAKWTLKGSLSVLKLIPGTYFNQTGNPLQKLNKKNS